MSTKVTKNDTDESKTAKQYLKIPKWKDANGGTPKYATSYLEIYEFHFKEGLKFEIKINYRAFRRTKYIL